MCSISDSHIMHGSWDMECNRPNFLSFWTVFCPFTPLTTQKIKILKKIEKLPGDIILLHRCNINDNHMMHGSWGMKHDRQNFLPFLTVFCPFTALRTQKNQNFEKLKKTSSYIINLHMWTINDNHMMYCSWDMKHDRQNLLSFWTVFCPFTLLKKKQKKLERSF